MWVTLYAAFLLSMHRPLPRPIKTKPFFNTPLHPHNHIHTHCTEGMSGRRKGRRKGRRNGPNVPGQVYKSLSAFSSSEASSSSLPSPL